VRELKTTRIYPLNNRDGALVLFSEIRIMAEKTEVEKELSPEQEKLLEGGGIKFVAAAAPADSCTNGDAKIEMGGGATLVSAGLKKEELMKFANDPFWVRLRWFLFLLFWLTWLAMLVGAIYIVVVAPKCPAPEPRLWWEKGQLVVADAQDDGGLAGIKNCHIVYIFKFLSVDLLINHRNSYASH